MKDPIERQDAIDTLNVSAELLRRVLDNADVVGADREKYLWGLGLIESSINDIEELPSAQPEIIRCRDCKHYYFADNRIPQEQRYVCDLDGDRWKPDDYCSFAERMKGEQE